MNYAPVSSSGDPNVQNLAARQLIVPGPGKQTVRRIQQIYSSTISNYVAGQQITLNIAPAATGIITRFLVEITASIGIGGAETQNRVQNGAAAILSNVQYVDPSNQTRINVPGWALNLLSTSKRRNTWQAAFASDINSLCGLGANFTSLICACPATLNSAPGAQNFAMVYEVPLAYSKDDLTGAVLAAMLNATQSLNLTINPNFFVTSTDTVNVAEAGYQSTTAVLGKISSLTVKVSQEYIDQIAGLPLPNQDLTTQYLLQGSGGFQPVANTDLTIPFANFRKYLSTTFRFNNNGVFNAGTDINYVAIRTAGGTDLEKMDPAIVTLRNREWMGVDPPAGYYILQHRERPIFTDSYGNVSLVVNASSVGGLNSSIYAFWEGFAPTANLVNAGSTATGG